MIDRETALKAAWTLVNYCKEREDCGVQIHQ